MKIITRRGANAHVGRIVRARQQANADVNLARETKKDPVYHKCRLTGKEFYFGVRC